jgi:hypothetical protein
VVKRWIKLNKFDRRDRRVLHGARKKIRGLPLCHGITKHTLRLNVVLNKFDKRERRVLSEVYKKRKGLPLPS